MEVKRVFDIVGRAYMYFKLGWSNYYALVLGMTAYLVIIYNYVLSKYLPLNAIIYVGLGILVIFVSIITGYLSKRSGFWGREHQISTEANPVLNYPIGEKEVLGYDSSILGHEASVLGYDSSILGYETTILQVENQIKVNEKLGVDPEYNAMLKANIGQWRIMLEELKRMRLRVIDMLGKLREMRAKGVKNR